MRSENYSLALVQLNLFCTAGSIMWELEIVCACVHIKVRVDM